MSDEIEKLKAKMTKKSDANDIPKGFLSSGSSLLNLTCTGNLAHCYGIGTYTHLVGDSDSGKSILALTAFAEASLDPNFKDYDFVLSAAESNSVDLLSCIGPKAEKRLEIIEEVFTPEEFYDDLDKRLKKKPCIVVLDSMDALTSEKDAEKIEEEAKAREKGKEISGSYGTAKARTNSNRLRIACNDLKRTDRSSLSSAKHGTTSDLVHNSTQNRIRAARP